MRKRRRSSVPIEDNAIKEESNDVYAPPKPDMRTFENISNHTETEFAGVGGLLFFKPADRAHFGALLDTESTSNQSTVIPDKHKQILTLVLKAKNGAPSTRRLALRSLTNRLAELNPTLIFDIVIPILLDTSLDDQERYIMVKLVDRVLHKLASEGAQPYAERLLNAISPMLNDNDAIVRSAGQSVVMHLSSVVGVKSIILCLRSKLDDDDEYVRNLSATALTVASKPLGLIHFIPLINALCHSKKSWKVRHTGTKIVQQVVLLYGAGVLPFLKGLVVAISPTLQDEHFSTRILSANTLASLAQAAYPYGIDSFSNVIEDLWLGTRKHRGRLLASFLNALAFIVPLMEPTYASYYSIELMRRILHEINTADEDMKKAVLQIIQNCTPAEAITVDFLRKEIGPQFFKNFWTRRIALHKTFNKRTIFVTSVIAEKLGCSFVIDRLLGPLRDDSEPLRAMALNVISRIVEKLGIDDLTEPLEYRLIDAMLVAFQEQTNHDNIMLTAFRVVGVAMGKKLKPYLPPIISTILANQRHRSPQIREAAAELCSVLIPLLHTCGEQETIDKLSIVAYESLGEMYPEVLGAVLGIMCSTLATVDVDKVQPPVNQILPTLTPILRNKHTKVQLNIIKLIGHIAERGPTYVSSKEWMRICFELLETLRNPNKGIRRLANNTFGHIAKAIGPQDVLVVLLENLRVQERQLRVCSAVAIGIIAVNCGTYTVLPALMNEYRTPDTNIQNGVLKAITFVLEYIGDLLQDYIYFLVPLLEDALTDRDLVHRQTAATAIKHLALYGKNCGMEDAFVHLLNLLLPNILETSPHVISRIMDGLEALCYAMGPAIFTNYLWSGMFHPSKRVRKAYWYLYNKVYVKHQHCLVTCYPNVLQVEANLSELDLIL